RSGNVDNLLVVGIILEHADGDGHILYCPSCGSYGGGRAGRDGGDGAREVRGGAGRGWGARGLTGRSVTSQDFGAVGAAGGGGAVGVQGDGPAPLVNGHVMLKKAVQGATIYAGLAALGQV